MPKTLIILHKNCEIQLSQQKEAMMAIAKSLNLCNITCFETIQDSYKVLESDNITILVQNLDSISSFYHDYPECRKTSYIIPSESSWFISVKDDIDVCLSDFSVIEALQTLKGQYEILESYAV